MKKIEFFKVEGDRIDRIRKHCPKCGPAVFLAEHKNRFSCGKCGYTEFKGGGRKEPMPPKQEEVKPIESEVKVEQPVEEKPPELSNEEQQSAEAPKEEEQPAPSSDAVKEEPSVETPVEEKTGKTTNGHVEFPIEEVKSIRLSEPSNEEPEKDDEELKKEPSKEKNQ